MTDKAYRWRRSALAVAASFGLWAGNAMALSLGRVTVQSALGEPLHAEVEVLNINADEAASLKTALASPESFKAAGLDYSATTANIQASLQKLPDGRAYIRLSSERPINEPFVDLILETSWASGRIVRDYTLLFDPPNLRSAAVSSPTPAQVPVQIQTPARQANEVRSESASAAQGAARPSRPVKVAARTATPANGQVVVKAGDTASKIAAATRQDNISLDQMLVALLRANPQAFVGGNVNRIKAGAIVDIPAAEQAAMTPAAEATQMVVAQSRDFNEFRRKLASSAPETTLAVADRRASGAIQARVEDKKPAAGAPDKLTLSKGAVKELSAQDQIANERRSKDAANRAAELSRNISELGKLGAASSTTASRPARSASAPGTASTPVAGKQPVAVASAPAPVSSMAVKRPPTVAASAPQAGPLDGLMENPLLAAGAGGLIALLAFLGIYRARQRKTTAPVDDLLPEDQSRPDAFFAVSGGQSVDTQKATAVGTPVSPAPSQPAIVEPAHPVAEAAVNMSHGRDSQAEEIPKETSRPAPAPAAAVELAAAAPEIPSQNSGPVDLDLDLDFSLDEQPVEAARETSASAAQTAPGKLPIPPAEPPSQAAPAPDHDMLEFDLGSLSLDLDDAAEPEANSTPDVPQDPLATKLALAEEFSAIGDTSGARTLIEEVIAEASGDMKLKAQIALGKLPAT